MPLVQRIRRARLLPLVLPLVLCLLWGGAAAAAQTPPPAAPSPLDAYVMQGLESNLVLQQRRLDFERSLRALDEARGLFLPSLDLEARYSIADGGREIGIPTGDLLNPAYGALNDLLAAQGQNPSFPTVENASIPLLREREQETKLRLTQPLYEPRIWHNARLRRHLARSQEAALEAYRRQLVRDIKVAYFGYLQAEQGVAIFEVATELVEENLRTNQSLFLAHKITQDNVFRARAEVLRVEQERAEAEKERDLARSYFNFLLNRELDTPIETLPDEEAWPAFEQDAARLALASLEQDVENVRKQPAVLAGLREVAMGQREELDRLAAAAEAADAQARVARTAFLPSVGLALDAGIQGKDYGFTGERPFYLASVMLSWNLFNGFQDRARVQQARLEAERLRTEREEVADRIRLDVQDAYDQVLVSRRSLRTAEERVQEVRKSFRITSRRYEEGMANLVTFTDARVALTSAELNRNVTRYDFLIRLAELEYAAGLFPLATAIPSNTSLRR